MIELHLTLIGLDPERHYGGGIPQPEMPWQWPDPAAAIIDGPWGPLAERLAQGRLQTMDAPAPADSEPVCDDDPDALALRSLLGSDTVPTEIADAAAALRWRGDRRLGAPQPDFLGPDSAWPDNRAISAFDPVHLKAETDHAVVFGGRLLGLSGEETDRLYADLDHWLKQDGLRLLRGVGDRGYLMHGEEDAALLGERDLPPLACALNRNAEPLMTGDDALRPLRRWLTEVQMWLHLHPMNEARAHAGRPTVNSFWVHGRSTPAAAERAMAAMAERIPTDALILTDSPLLLGLLPQARVWNADLDLSTLGAESIHLLLTDPAWCWLEGDEQGWLDALTVIDDWLARQRHAMPDLAWVVDDGRGRRWQAAGRLDRLWRSLATAWKRLTDGFGRSSARSRR